MTDLTTPRDPAIPDFILDLGTDVTFEQYELLRGQIKALLRQARQSALDDVRREVEAEFRSGWDEAARNRVAAIIGRLREPQP